MTVPEKYKSHYAPIKYFLSSYRALSDGRDGIRQLNEKIDSGNTYLFDWKIAWIGTCAVLRTSIDLFKVDEKSCLSPRIREEIDSEWKYIKDKKEEHAIFWEFLRRERDNIIHEYKWRTYEAWMKPDGYFHLPTLGHLILNNDGSRPVLKMGDGVFKGRDSLELLKAGADWVEDRIFNAIRRAGFDPDEDRDLFTFQPRPKIKSVIFPSLSEDDDKAVVS